MADNEANEPPQDPVALPADTPEVRQAAQLVKDGCGRPTKLTDETLERIILALTMGLSNRTVAHFARIHESTFYEWITNNEEFAELVACAKASAVVHATVKLAQNINKGQNDAIKFFLERRSEEYQRKAPIIIADDDASLEPDEEFL